MINITARGYFIYNKRKPLKEGSELTLFTELTYTSFDYSFYTGNHHLTENRFEFQSNSFNVYWCLV